MKLCKLQIYLSWQVNLSDIKLTITLIWCIYTTNSPEYCPETSAEAQLLLTRVTLFYKLCHPLPHGPFFNSKRSVTKHINVYLVNYAIRGKRSIGSLFCKDRKSVRWLPVMNAMASKDNEGHIVPNGTDDVRCPIMMTDYAQLFIFVLY